MTVTFKIDTGAEVSVISETTLRQLQTVQLKKPTRSLYGQAMSHLKVTGHFTANLAYNVLQANCICSERPQVESIGTACHHFPEPDFQTKLC